MKRKIFAVLLIGFISLSVPVLADWVLINSDANKGVAHYFDPTTVRNSGDHYKKVWVLSSYAEKQKGGYRSLKTFYEFDCEAERARSYTMLLYSGVMATGNTVGAHHDELKEWFLYPASSFFKRISATICNN
ncbi:surface-adhesin E family protein [Nitrosomonas sp.]|uniref:surface-adhesin E family protein n=1 Tax=Nitrosomonas sp. TaxID=42353 RepID=UPI00208C78AE|nr:surface-adhesin E family protein [Nitrosomonas sp.]GJL74589.1 MAG: hypothetical protein NMNS02_06950 [Nitrosomonas sp.]